MKINKFIEKNICKIITIYIFIQPFLDVITAISIKKFNIDLTLGAITRLLFLLFTIYYLLILNKDNKKMNKILLLLLGVYFSSFLIVTYIYKDIHALSYELKNTLNTFYFPITLIAFIEMFKQYNINFKLKNIVCVFMIYILFIIIPALTNTSFLSYSHSKLGTVGWFLSANAIGNILSFLLPLVIYYLYKSKNKWLKIIIILTTLYVFASMGTKVPILSLVIIIFNHYIYYIIKNIKEKKWKSITFSISSILVITLISIILIPKTTFYKNIEIHMNFLGINHYSEILTNYDNVNNMIFSERLTFLKNTNNSYKKAHTLEKITGIGYIENYKKENESTKTIEIDYFEVLYRQGIIGFILFFGIIIYYIIKIFKIIFKKHSLLHLEFFTSIVLILLLSLFSGHILVTPAVSIFISILFAIILNEQKIDI